MNVEVIRERWERIQSHLDEKGRRLWCGNEALTLGFGGIEVVRKATGASAPTIRVGKRELSEGSVPADGIRRKGGGRKRAADKDSGLLSALRNLVSGATRGDPESPLLWCSKSTRNLSKALLSAGYKASHTLVSTLLREEGHRLQVNRKTKEGSNHPDRDG